VSYLKKIGKSWRCYMFQNIGVFQKISDFDISGTCGGKKIHVYKNKNIFFIHVFIGVKWVGARRGWKCPCIIFSNQG